MVGFLVGYYWVTSKSLHCFRRLHHHGGATIEATESSFNSSQEYTRLHQTISVPIHVMLADQAQGRKVEIWNAVTAEMTRYANLLS
ncbi:MAG: hypothetical protein WBZ36_13040 [Candidatus Nitrosopolaris sp.]